MTKIDWLRMELEAAEEAWKDAVTDSGHASARAQYWVGYKDAITNALHDLSGMGE